MRDLIATKGFTYGTRRLTAEDPFSARTAEDARLLVALGRARYVTADGRAAEQQRPTPNPDHKLAASKPPRAPRAARKAKQA